MTFDGCHLRREVPDEVFAQTMLNAMVCGSETGFYYRNWKTSCG